MTSDPSRSDRWSFIQVDAQTLALGNALGLTSPCEDGIHELTPEGAVWLREWRKRKLAERGRNVS